jgi:hypothetical protein
MDELTDTLYQEAKKEMTHNSDFNSKITCYEKVIEVTQKYEY